MQSKTNTQILLQQFKRSEQDRKAYIVQKEELEAELASRLRSEDINIAKIQESENELASRIKTESTMADEIRSLKVWAPFFSALESGRPDS